MMMWAMMMVLQRPMVDPCGLIGERKKWSQAGLVAMFPLLLPVLARSQGYTDRASELGLNFTVGVQALDFGSGVSFFDVDGDGWDDLTFGATLDTLQILRNEGGTFVRTPARIYGQGEIKQVLWADIDNDGDVDLLTTTFGGPVRLFRNDGDWQFTDITVTAGFGQQIGPRYGASFGDYDRDGFLDLYVCSYVYDPNDPFAYSKLNHLYRNNGDGSFTDVTLQAGVENGMLASFQSAWIDVDMDGWPDLYVINDFEGGNALYRNNRNGTFTNVASAMGLDQPGEHSMSISLSDFDLDGDLDIFITNTGIFPDVNNARCMLMVNNGAGMFEEASADYGLDIFEWGWGGLWVDHDNDGYQDLYVATHRQLTPPVYDIFFRNEDGSFFNEEPQLLQGLEPSSGFALARGDVDRDGYSDIVIQTQDPYIPNLWVNDGGTAHWVRITLEGTVSNRMAIGSWIRVYAGGRTYVHYTVCGENYIAQSSQHILFGLGQASVVDSVEVEYLSGHRDRYYGLEVDRDHHFVEGGTYVVEVSADGPLSICGQGSVSLDAGEHEEYLWNTGHTERHLTVNTSGSYFVTVTNGFGVQATSVPLEVRVGPRPVVFSSSSHPACAGEATGSIVLSNLTGVPVESVEWEGGPQGASLDGLQAGVYQYVLMDENGCSVAGAVELIDPDPIFVLVSVQDALQGNDGSIAWTIFGGAPPFSVSVDGDPVTGSSVSGLEVGSYALVVTDAEGCEEEQVVVVDGPAGMTEREAGLLRVFPNPVGDLLFFETGRRIGPLYVRDMRGRLLMEAHAGWASAGVDVSALVAGTYVLELVTSEGYVHRALFIKER